MFWHTYCDSSNTPANNGKVKNKQEAQMKMRTVQSNSRFSGIKRRLIGKVFIYGLNLVFLVFAPDRLCAQLDAETDECAIGSSSESDYNALMVELAVLESHRRAEFTQPRGPVKIWPASMNYTENGMQRSGGRTI